MKIVPMIHPSSVPGQAGPTLNPVLQRPAISLRKAVGRTNLFEATMMSFHSSTRWTHRAARVALAILLLAAATDRSGAQDTPAVIAEITAAATVPVAIVQTNLSLEAKPGEGSKTDPAAGTSAKETAAPIVTRGPGTSATAKSNATPTLSFDSFNLIAVRNIFNQSRTPRRGGGQATSRPTIRVRVESIALVGTMIYEKGNFAFFDGSNSQYRKTLKPGDSIGAYKLTEVGPNQVKLSDDKQEWALKVGQELRRENEGEWILGARSSAGMVASSESASTSTNSSTDASAAADSEPDAADAAPIPDTGAVSDVIRRMMEARAKEEGR